MLTTGPLAGNCGNTLTTSGLTLSDFPEPPRLHTGPNHTVVDTFLAIDLPYTVAVSTANQRLRCNC